MNSQAILFSVIAMLAWGSAAIFDKIGMKGLTNPYTALMVRIGTAFVAVYIAGWATGNIQELRHVPKANLGALIIGGMLAAIVGQLAYFTALKHADASRIVPFTASYPVIAMLLAFALLGESLTLHKILGTLMVLGGLLLVSGTFSK
jgi:transporter family protein